MGWLTGVLCGIGTMAIWLIIVPRVRITTPPTGEPPPQLALLPTPARTVVLFAATVALAQLLRLVPADDWWLWIPYLVFGAPLVFVDALTTWLPLRLHYLAAAAMAVGLLVIAVPDWSRAMGAVAFGLAAFGVFHLIWRIGTGLGYGDVRLASLLGAVGGLSGLEFWLVSLTAGTIIGALWAIGHSLRRRSRPDLPKHFAYGPSLWLGPFAAIPITAI